MTGPLKGYRIVELAGIGPGPFAGMMLADMGAEVVRVERKREGPNDGSEVFDVLNRGRRSIGVDLKTERGQRAILQLIEAADGFIEGYRPGVAERLGVGPASCLERNPRLVYGRMTGWGQDGPLARAAGHDIDYIALAGTLSLIGLPDRPPIPPLNLVGDFGGGGMLLAFGMVCALLEAARSGRGQIVDAAMIDGAALISAMIWGFYASGIWGKRGTNLLDGGAWFYGAYECADGNHIAFGTVEPQFYEEMLRITGLADDVDGRGPLPMQRDQDSWPACRERLAAIIKTKTRDEWCVIAEGADACFAPVLTMAEAPSHPHVAARKTFVEVAGVTQPAPAPRFSRTPGEISCPPPRPGQDTDVALEAWGFSPTQIEELRAEGAVW